MTPGQRTQINRQNAQKSTGPNTPEGKDRSRQNALRHGLRAETIPLPQEDPQEVPARYEEWAAHFQPAGPAERALVEQAARADLRLTRCARHERAILVEQFERLKDEHTRALEAEADEHLARLDRDPAGAVARLGKTSSGVRRLLTRWTRLGHQLEQPGGWSDGDRDEALRLLGVRPDPANPESIVGVVRQLHAATVDNLPESAEARAALAGLVRDERTRLDASRQEHEQREAAALAQSGDRCLLITDRQAAALFLRYENSAMLNLQRALKNLAALQKARPQPTEESAPVPAPEPQTLPNEANRAAEGDPNSSVVGDYGEAPEPAPGPAPVLTAPGTEPLTCGRAVPPQAATPEPVSHADPTDRKAA